MNQHGSLGTDCARKRALARTGVGSGKVAWRKVFCTAKPNVLGVIGVNPHGFELVVFFCGVCITGSSDLATVGTKPKDLAAVGESSAGVAVLKDFTITGEAPTAQLSLIVPSAKP